jgi:arylesterase/paraoxonase
MGLNLKMRYSGVFGAKSSSVGYCHIDDGCKYAITGTHGSNGIVAAPNGTVYVADSLYGGVLFLEPQTDNTLVVSESVKTGTRYIAQCIYRSSVLAFVQIMHSTI